MTLSHQVKNKATKQRPVIFAGNWKMNLSPGEAIAYFGEMPEYLRAALPSHHKRVIFPVAYCLGSHVQQAANPFHFELGAQNIHYEEKGAFTGELSGVGLKHLGIHWALIGHSERRQYFGETDETAGRRLGRALALGFNVIYCIGEKLEDREAGRTESVLARQLGAFEAILKTAEGTAALANPDQIVALAYEPVWAIGTGRTATAAQAQQAHAFIRQFLQPRLGSTVSEKTPVLYGGSVTPENAKELLGQPDVDGVLVGGASLKPDGFVKILHSL